MTDTARDRGPGEDGDAFPGADTARRQRLVAGLTATLRSPELPSRLQQAGPWEPTLSRRGARWVPGPGRSAPFIVTLTVLLLVCGVTLALAASGILDLGKPTNDLSGNEYFPVDGFHRISTALTLSGRPEVLIISAQNDAPSAVERWPLVKALEQFGTFTHVGTSAAALPPFMGDALNAPTFDLTHAVYRSRYVAFVHKDVLDTQNRYYQKLNSVEEKLYTRYVRVNKGCGPDPNDPQHFICTMYQALTSGTHRFPLLAVGDYLQTESQFLYPAAFQDRTSLHALPFATVQAALQQQVEPFDGSQIVTQVNGETNIITALICHVDGFRPSKVCGRPVIKKLLKHVR